MSKITREKSHRARLERGMDSFFLTKMFDGEIYSQIKDHCRLVVLRFTPRMRKARLFWKAVCRNVSMVGLRVKRKRRQGKQWLWGVAWLHEARTSECSGHGPKAAGPWRSGLRELLQPSVLPEEAGVQKNPLPTAPPPAATTLLHRVEGNLCGDKIGEVCMKSYLFSLGWFEM